MVDPRHLITMWLLRRDGDRGAAIVEYALLVALIAVVCILAVTFFGSNTSQSFSRSGSVLNP